CGRRGVRGGGGMGGGGGNAGEGEEVDGGVGAGDDEPPVLEAQIRLGGFERFGGDPPPLLDDHVGGAPDRGAAHISRARAAMPAAERDYVGIALHEADHVVRQAEPVGEDLRKSRLVPLADRLRAGGQRSRAVRREADIDILARRATGRLDVIGEAEPRRRPRRSLSARRAPKPATSAAASAWSSASGKAPLSILLPKALVNGIAAVG